MKKEFLIWNVVLTLVVAVLLFFQFGPKKGNRNKGKVQLTDSTAGHHFRMAYFEMDSVEANYNMVKDVKAEINAKDIEYNNNLNKLDQTYRNKYNEYAQKPSMTPEETENASNVLKDLGEKLKNQKLDFDQKYQDFKMRKSIEVKNKIVEFIRDYNKIKGYSYIVSDDTGLFYYKDSMNNITSEVIKGLNELYLPQKK